MAWYRPTWRAGGFWRQDELMPGADDVWAGRANSYGEWLPGQGLGGGSFGGGAGGAGGGTPPLRLGTDDPLQWAMFQGRQGTENRQLDLQGELGRGNLALGGRRLDLEGELGRGNLALGQQRLGLEGELGRGNLALGGRRLDLEGELGRGNLALGGRRLDLDKLLGERRLGLEERQLNQAEQNALRQYLLGLAAPVAQWEGMAAQMPTGANRDAAIGRLMPQSAYWNRIANEGVYSPAEIGAMADQESQAAWDAIRSERAGAVNRAVAAGGPTAWLTGGGAGFGPTLAGLAASSKARLNANLANKATMLQGAQGATGVAQTLAELEMRPTAPTSEPQTIAMLRRLMQQYAARQ